MSEVGLFEEDFGSMLMLARQQKESKLRGRCLEGTHIGTMASVADYMAAYQSYTPQLYGPKQSTPNSYTRRWVSPLNKAISPLFDNFEQLRTRLNPRGQAPANIAATFNRDIDDILIDAAFATATISNTNGTTTTTESFSTSLYGIAEDYNNGTTPIGLTVEKLIRAIEIFSLQHVEEEDKTLVVGARQLANALSLVQIVSTEFNSRPVLTEAARGVRNLLGFDVVTSQRLAISNGISGNGSSNVRQCIALVRSGLYLGVWEDQTVDVHQRFDLDGDPWEFSARHVHGGTRLEPGRLLRVDCGVDSNGADITP